MVLPLFRSLAQALPGTTLILNQVKANYTNWVTLDAAAKKTAALNEAE